MVGGRVRAYTRGTKLLYVDVVTITLPADCFRDAATMRIVKSAPPWGFGHYPSLLVLVLQRPTLLLHMKDNMKSCVML